MDNLLVGAIFALGGGFIGAAIGGNFGFVMTGFTAWLGLSWAAATNSSVILDYVAFGPFMGPHVCFAGGVAAAAYAQKKGLIDSGRDVTSPLARLGQPDVLLVGAGFGLIGYLIQKLYAMIPGFDATHGFTDSVAMTVFTSAILVRLLISRQSLIVPERFNTDGRGKYAPNDTWGWVRYQEKPGQLAVIGGFFGIGAAGVVVAIITALTKLDPEKYSVLIGNAQVLPFAWSAVTILFLCLGMDMPVQHHMTLPAGLAAAKFLPIFAGAANVATPSTGAIIGALAIGAVFGILGGLLGEFWSRLLHQRGDSHIDPPAGAIFVLTTVIMGITAAMS